MEQLENLCVSHVEPILTVSSDLGLVNSLNKMNRISLSMDIPYPQIIASSEYEPNKTRIMFTGHKDWLFALTKKLETNDFKLSTSVQVGLFISGFGLTSSTYEQAVFEKLGVLNIKILKYIRDAKGLLLIYNQDMKQQMIEFAEKLI